MHAPPIKKSLSVPLLEKRAQGLKMNIKVGGSDVHDESSLVCEYGREATRIAHMLNGNSHFQASRGQKGIYDDRERR